MFSTITPLVSHTVRTRPAAPATTHSGRRFSASPSLDEAYEMRLLAEVARWDDQAAFEEIYARHHAAVTRAALQVCRDTGTAEEIVQQTFIALWVRAERLVDKSLRLRPWLTTVARNAAIDHLRAERPAASIADWELSSNASSPEDVAIAEEAKADLAKALATLPPAQRTAVELVYLAGMTYQSAAEMLEQPIGTVKSRVRLAIRHLRVRLARRSC